MTTPPIRTLLESAKRIAVVGASTNPDNEDRCIGATVRELAIRAA